MTSRRRAANVLYFREQDQGDCRIYAAAFEASQGTFIGAVVVNRLRGIPAAPAEVFRNERVGDCAWPEPDVALTQAVSWAEQMLHGRADNGAGQLAPARLHHS